MNVVENDYVSVVSGGKVTSRSTAIDEISIATKGLKATRINILGKKLEWESGMIARAIGTTTRTLERHVESKKPLNIKISENALELARLSTIGTDYFGSVKRWNEWLNTPHSQFENKEPREVMHTIRGRELIKRIILGLEHGFNA
ncbi:antitoxin Xre/MbcA/ParS toxin-binding domain-containing protein [Pseudoalteromonas sp. TAB23]|uniref:antitoxin Xre/MbcA/ParS toxin-binding domain-containing protein n=1 Tax=Pseudoalteromonas sp. TAB23 TaxID=1938595 RepID=UPI000463ABC3|nr:antitoxin Xre/MbcA/ParS toxin-binding domain-containing protein [Pseudoalteromonas sp. TAB23]